MVLAALFALLVSQHADSTALLRRARLAQTDFEWARKLRLPFAVARTGGGCDARIGRFCYWHDASARRPPPEPAEIGAARERLIRMLDSVADRVPGDEWIAGQRVRYLLEAGRPADALAAARHCRATPWWCEALDGLARHVAGDYPGADQAFRTALAHMPASTRCRWTDLSVLLEGRVGRAYGRLGCDERTRRNPRIWWLAQPLLSRAGNDRRTEHFARRTLAHAWRDAASPYGLQNGSDQTELMERYGWPVGWSQSVSPAGPDAGRTVIGSEREPSYHFLPESLAVPGPTVPGDAPWARERYAPAYADAFEFIEPEIAAFRRGDSTVVIAIWDLSQDTLFRGLEREAALVLARDEMTVPVVTRQAGAAVSGLLVARAPWEPGLVSLEITAPAERRAARGRLGLRMLRPPGQRVVVSDLLAFDPSDSLPTDLSDVLPAAHSLLDLPRGTRVGLYWEVYGLAAGGERLATAVRVVPERIGWLRRAAGSLGLASRPRRAELAWTESGVPRNGVAPRALVLDLSTLPPGDYRIEVTVRAEGAPAAVAARPMRIVPQ